MAKALSIEEVLALPASIDVETAGRAVGIGRTTAHSLARRGEFPCKVHRIGSMYRVTRTDLLRFLGIHDPAVPSAFRVTDKEMADSTP
jgi:hypothetical protein